MDNKDIAREWFELAEADLSSARFLKKMRPIPLEIICYHCQQGTEKYLKGFLALNGQEITKTHDLILLNKHCARYDPDFKTIVEDCVILTDYGVNIRYPFHLDINEADMKLALKSAQKIKRFVLNKTKSN